MHKDWKQHYPTYSFSERDIVLEEYKTAAKTFDAEERIFITAANLTVFVFATVGSLTIGYLDKIMSVFKNMIPEYILVSVLLFNICGFSLLFILYFSERQRAIVCAARKVIVLRRMLGINYGHINLVLPSKRIEGADNPFSIRFFPGWKTSNMYPCYAIAGISSTLVFLLLAILFHASLSIEETALSPLVLSFIISMVWFLYLSLSYRVLLKSEYERRCLFIAVVIAKTLRLRLVSNFESVIYHVNLARYELSRLNIDLKTAKTLLVFIEDKQFYGHHGVSIYGLGRMFLYIIGLVPGFKKMFTIIGLRRYRKTGGSTITQQLVRTLFIIDQKKTIRRKIVEIMLAIWFNSLFPKDEQLELYLSSVRFEHNVNGIAGAMNHFFGKIKKSLSRGEAFFLIERVSNIHSKLHVDKIAQIIIRAKESNMLSADDIKEIISIYNSAFIERTLISSDEEIQIFANKLS